MTFTRKITPALLTFALLVAGCDPTSRGAVDEEKDPLFAQATSRRNAGDIPGAIQLYEQALNANPGNASVHLELGLLYERSENDFVAAVYHFEKFLQLRPNSDREVPVKDHILTCKQELAKTVLPASLPQTAERELMALSRKNEELRHELDLLRSQYSNALVALSNQSARIVQAPPDGKRNPVPTGQLPDRQQSGSNQPATGNTQVQTAARKHVVAGGETLSSISRRYGISLEALKAANPGVNERRLQVGQALLLPSR